MRAVVVAMLWSSACSFSITGGAQPADADQDALVGDPDAPLDGVIGTVLVFVSDRSGSFAMYQSSR